MNEPQQLQLPHTQGCLVCGRDNPHGLKLDFFVSDANVVTAKFVPAIHHCGFEGIVHGGMLATVLDETMTWSATWSIKRFCLCAEMTIRLRQSASAESPLFIESRPSSIRSKLIEVHAEIRNAHRTIVATSSGKYVPLSLERHARFVKTIVEDPCTRAAGAMLIHPE